MNVTGISLDEARHQASANRKADFLFAQGYRAERVTDQAVTIRTPRGGAVTVDIKGRRCTCSGFQRHGYCSHLWGYLRLLWEQALYASNAAEGGYAHGRT